MNTKMNPKTTFASVTIILFSVINGYKSANPDPKKAQTKSLPREHVFPVNAKVALSIR